MNKNIEVLLYVSDYNWDESTRRDLVNLFKDFDAKHDEKAAIGAGASGPFPEVNLLVVVSAALGLAVGQVGRGFLNAIGEDAWKALKQSIKQAGEIKPDRINSNIPKELKLPQKSEIIWWNYFTDKQFLVHLPTNNTKEWDEALTKLPDAVDKANKENPSFIRLIWNDGEWKAI